MNTNHLQYKTRTFKFEGKCTKLQFEQMIEFINDSYACGLLSNEVIEFRKREVSYIWQIDLDQDRIKFLTEQIADYFDGNDKLYPLKYLSYTDDEVKGGEISECDMEYLDEVVNSEVMKTEQGLVPSTLLEKLLSLDKLGRDEPDGFVSGNEVYNQYMSKSFRFISMMYESIYPVTHLNHDPKVSAYDVEVGFKMNGINPCKHSDIIIKICKFGNICTRDDSVECKMPNDVIEILNKCGLEYIDENLLGSAYHGIHGKRYKTWFRRFFGISRWR